MIQHTTESSAWGLQIRNELLWLQANHPDKTALIAMAMSHVKTMEMAGATGTSSYPPEKVAGRKQSSEV